jgi:hypothetical protein
MSRLSEVEDFAYDLIEGRLVLAGRLAALAAEKTRRRVADVVDGEPRTVEELREEIEPDEDGRRPSVRTVREVLNTLVDSGEAVRQGTGKKGDAYRWHLVQEER